MGDGSNPNRRIRAQHASAALLQHIRKRMDDGSWPVGHRLPPERELVGMFGMARNTLRKALIQLEEDGVIVKHVGRGTFIARLPSQPADESAAESLLARIYGASPADVMELRLVLEPPFVENAATRATGRDLQQIVHCLEQSERADTVLDFEHWDGMLHHAILASSHNHLLIDLYEAINGVRKQPEWEALKQRSLTPDRKARYMAQHRAIVKALLERDASAASQAVRDHLLEVKAGMTGS
ncbi:MULTISPECIES: FCD domain-containing protein [Rhodanobacteraceae]|uniref:FadR/GntR family transcriptional regulator n=1 Tax=Rhodanobacteraceae TaxID=1775411 RepID=UPI000889F7D5|nr:MULTISPECIES: FCD domain-containing protein [Rhodanobacteraceae]SDG02673.1 DNA-binding transcriptional regulator, FadR family [Dyella sp. 333MFSha]SKB30561.1 transcriptional regulator, GntR family [Luteibacter sp. 22Crub2.1]